MLLNFGVYSYITSIYNKDYERDYYELELAGKELDLYNSYIGFNKNAKSIAVVNTLGNEPKNRNTNNDVIPFQKDKVMTLYNNSDPQSRSRQFWKVFSDICQSKCELTYKQIGRVIDSIEEEHPLLSDLLSLQDKNYIYSPIVGIERSRERTFDFTLPKTHSFWSNGFISHNTSIALRTVGNAQKMGDLCCWFDAEAAFSPNLALINDVDIENLIMPDLAQTKKSQSSDDNVNLFNASEVLEMIYKTVISNVFGLVVLDSVAGLMPERVLDDNFDPNKAGVAEVARSMSQMLGKIAQACHKRQTTVIFINQLRDKPGEMFGTRFHTPGGRALKFFAHQRISVERRFGEAGKIIGTDEEGVGQLLGHYARTTIVKNKMAPPVPSEVKIDIPVYYVKYNPDDAKKCYDLARSLQVITIRNGILKWKSLIDEDVIINEDGESAALGVLRDRQLESRLAYECELAANTDKNKNKKQPTRVPHTLKELAATYKNKDNETIKDADKS